MTVLTRAQAQAQADLIREATGVHVLTPEIVGAYLRSIADTVVFPGDAQTPPTAGNGLTGTNVFSVLPDGATIGVSASGVKIPDQAGNSVLGRAPSSSGAVAPIAGTDGQAFRVSGATLGFGTLATAAYADASVTTVKIADSNVTTAKIADANVTLAKMASIVTDSLVGRDTAGTGAPENITLNATLSMTGAGALQRAALTGAVSASAGSNTTAFASGDFGSLQVKTTNSFFASGTAWFGVGELPSSGTGAHRSMAATGDIRLPRGSASIVARNDADGNDINVIYYQSNVAGVPVIDIGDSVGPTTAFVRVKGGNAGELRAGTNPVAQWGLSAFNLQAASVFRVRTDATGVALYTATTVAQAARPGQITDNSTGAATSAVADVGAVFSQAGLNNIHATILAKLNAIELALHNLGAVA